MGLTDKLVEVRANCVKELLGILDESQLVRNKSDFSASGPGSETVESALTDFSFLNSEECDSANATKLSQLGVTPTEVEPSSAPSTEESDDVEIACALAEFDLLVAQQSECAGVVGSSVGSLDSFSYPVDINPHSIADPEWIFGDQSALVDRLTEKYRMYGTVRLWNIPPSLQQSAFGTGNTSAATLPPTSLAANRVYRPAALLPPSAPAPAAAAASLPTSVTFLSTDADSFAVGLTTGEVCVISLESGRLLTLFESHQSAMPNTCGENDCCLSALYLLLLLLLVFADFVFRQNDSLLPVVH
nr:unnamed protein product [Spirometra erinaceieuropaei]